MPSSSLFSTAGTPPLQLDQIEREIAAPAAEIDGLLYEPYVITDEERKIIEGQA